MEVSETFVNYLESLSAIWDSLEYLDKREEYDAMRKLHKEKIEPFFERVNSYMVEHKEDKDGNAILSYYMFRCNSFLCKKN